MASPADIRRMSRIEFHFTFPTKHFLIPPPGNHQGQRVITDTEDFYV
jgi:hypothetical protein